MATWTTRTCIETCPERVLELLTDPDACERWSPVRFDIAARYEAVAKGSRTELRAAVSVDGGGFAGRLMSRAAHALLASGVLDSTLSRIAREAEPRRRWPPSAAPSSTGTRPASRPARRSPRPARRA